MVPIPTPPHYAERSSTHQTVMPCMQIVFSNSKSGGWISMDPSPSWTMSVPFGIAASLLGGVGCGWSGGWGGAGLPGLPGQRNCRGSLGSGRPLGRTQDVSSCRRGGPGRPASPPSGEPDLPLCIWTVMGHVSSVHAANMHALADLICPTVSIASRLCLKAGISCPRRAFRHSPDHGQAHTFTWPNITFHSPCCLLSSPSHFPPLFSLACQWGSIFPEIPFPTRLSWVWLSFDEMS